MDNKLENAWRNHPRTFAQNMHVYPVLSRRAGGISLGVNLNLDGRCNFDCPYCQVDRKQALPPQQIDIQRICEELWQLIEMGNTKKFSALPIFSGIAEHKLQLRDIALSGDGEPTLVPEFAEVCKALASLQKQCLQPVPRLTLITNATLLHLPSVQQGVQFLTQHDGEVWGKLDAGTEDWFKRISLPRHSLEHIEKNLCLIGKQFPLRLQTMFCALDGELPSTKELEAWSQRVANVFHQSGTNFREVQIYSLARRTTVQNCTPAPIHFLDFARQFLTTQNIPCAVYG